MKAKVDVIFLSPAVVRTSISFNGSTIPAGTVVVARDDVTWKAFHEHPKTGPLQFNLCFAAAHLCTVSYHLADRPVASAQLQEASLELILQGWQKVPGGFFKPTPEKSVDPTDEPYPSPRDYPTKLSPFLPNSEPRCSSWSPTSRTPLERCAPGMVAPDIRVQH